jgi:hypothetical protein
VGFHDSTCDFDNNDLEEPRSLLNILIAFFLFTKEELLFQGKNTPTTSFM